MPMTTTKIVGAEWVELTDADTTKFTVQNKGSYGLIVAVSAGAVPADDTSGMLINPGFGISDQLSEIWPGQAGATRLFARCPVGGSCSVFVSCN